MRRRQLAAEQQAEPPAWVTSFLAGLRHIGSVDADGNVTLEKLPELYRRRDDWMAENGFERGTVT